MRHYDLVNSSFRRLSFCLSGYRNRIELLFERMTAWKLKFLFLSIMCSVDHKVCHEDIFNSLFHLVFSSKIENNCTEIFNIQESAKSDVSFSIQFYIDLSSPITFIYLSRSYHRNPEYLYKLLLRTYQ